MSDLALRLFMSYSRRDSGIADQLVAQLENQGFEVIIDRRDLPYGEEWQEELRDFIQSCDTIVWLVSPASIESRWCMWELGEVRRVGKRLLPVLVEELADKNLPEMLGRIHVLPAEGVYEPDVHFDPLCRALRNDQVWIKEYSRLTDRAHSWTRRGRNKDQLLRGIALSDAESWQDRRPQDAPRLSENVMDFIQTSRRMHATRLRKLVAGALVAAGAAVALSLVAVFQWQDAVAARDVATTQQARAEAEKERAENEQARAETQKERAEAAQQRAENALRAAVETTDGMVFGLSQDLETLGVPAEGTRALIDAARLLQEKLYEVADDDPLIRAAVASSAVEYADTLVKLGEIDEALVQFDNAIAALKELAVERPDTFQFQHNITTALGKKGISLLGRDNGAARLAFEEVVSRKALMADLEGVALHASQRSYLSGVFGLVQIGMDNPNLDHEPYLEEALELAESLIAAEPNHLNNYINMFQLLQVSASHQIDRDKAASLAQLERAKELYERALENVPRNELVRLHGVTINEKIALFTREDDLSKATEVMEQVVQERRQLLTASPRNRKHKQALGIALSTLAFDFLKDDFARSAPLIEESIVLREDLLALEPTNARYQSDLALALSRHSLLMQKAGDAEGALPIADRAAQLIRTMAIDDNTPMHQYRNAWSISYDAAWIAKKTDAKAALTRLEFPVRFAMNALTEFPDDTQFRKNLALSLDLLEELPAEFDVGDDLFDAYQLAIEGREALWLDDPDNKDHGFAFSNVMTQAADRVKDRNPDIAMQLYEQATAVDRDLIKLEPGAAFRHTNLAVTLNRMIALLPEDRADDIKALRIRVTDLRRTSAKLSPDHMPYQRNLFLSLFVLSNGGHNAIDGFAEARDVLISAGPEPFQDDYPAFLKEVEDKLAEALGIGAYNSLLAGKATQAEVYSNDAIALRPDTIWLYTNLAHALMLQDRLAQADAIYDSHIGQYMNAEKNWEDVIADDFKDLRAAGVDHPHINRVLERFAAVKIND